MVNLNVLNLQKHIDFYTITWEARLLQVELTELDGEDEGRELVQPHLRGGNSAWEQRIWEEGERLEDMTDKNYSFFFFFLFTLLPINSSFSVQGFREQAVYL